MGSRPATQNTEPCIVVLITIQYIDIKYMLCVYIQGKAKGTPSGVKTLFSAWNSVGTHKVRLGTPTHALPHGTPAFKTTFTKCKNTCFPCCGNGEVSQAAFACVFPRRCGCVGVCCGGCPSPVDCLLGGSSLHKGRECPDCLRARHVSGAIAPLELALAVRCRPLVVTLAKEYCKI